MALTTWRTILLGVAFEICSDHDSLKYLFIQKAPSQHILQLCEFLADYNFTEIKYVLGPEKLVLDFLSRPWDKTTEPSPIHMLVSAPSDLLSSLHTLQRSNDPSVIVKPVWRSQVAVQERQGTSGLWSKFLSPGESNSFFFSFFLALSLRYRCRLRSRWRTPCLRIPVQHQP